MVKMKQYIPTSAYGPLQDKQELSEPRYPKQFQDHLVEIGVADPVANKALGEAPENKKKDRSPENKSGSASQPGRASRRKTAKKSAPSE